MFVSLLRTDIIILDHFQVITRFRQKCQLVPFCRGRAVLRPPKFMFTGARWSKDTTDGRSLDYLSNN